MADVTMKPCGDCGMPCTPAEYHPYAACLMFKACHNSAAVRANLPDYEALRKRCEAVEFELDCLRTQYEERTAYTIVHRGAALCCSSAMRDAYSDEHHRAERLAKALNIAHRHIDMAALRISHCKDAEAIAAAQEPSHG